MEQIAGDPSVDLYAPVPHGDGYWARGKMKWDLLEKLQERDDVGLVLRGEAGEAELTPRYVHRLFER
jgi:hypothetical protein